MRLRTQLFLGTTSLIVILLAVQAWLQTRQLRAMEEELSEVASWVTHSVINTRVIHDDDPSDETSDEPGSERHVETRVYRTSSSSDDEDDSSAELPHLLDLPDSLAGKKVVIISREEVVRSASDKDVPIPPDPPPVPELPDGVRVETDIVSPEGRFLVIKGLPSGDQRIQVPTNGATRIVQKTLEESVVASIVVLLLGMALVAVWSHRVTRPLRELATAAEAVGRGELGNQIPTTSTGELGELERAFNDMSTRLQVLTHERERWRAREHLAELGELSRGLGHTLRNPLHTLGLVVEELATGHPENEKELVATARLQIRRVDRWLQSFLAVGAGNTVRYSTELSDPSGCYDASTWTYTSRSPGQYRVTAAITLAVAIGTRVRLAIVVNGTASTARYHYATTANPCAYEIDAVVDVSAGAAITINADQNSAGAVSVTSNISANENQLSVVQI